MLSSTRAAALLDDLCVRFGFCLPEAEARQLVSHPPSDPEAFASAVVLAEGLAWAELSAALQRQLLEVIYVAFAQPDAWPLPQAT